MAVRVGDDPGPVPHFQRVMEKPFEGPPRGVDLHGFFKAAVMGHLYVGVAAAAVGKDHHVPFPVGRQGFEQVVGRRAIRRDIGPVLDQCVGRPPDLASLFGEVDVAVPAKTRVARPLVARKNHEFSVLLEPGRELVQPLPKPVGDLEIVALMPRRVDKGAVPGEGEIVAGVTGADGLFRLAVKVGPVVNPVGVFDDPKGVGLGDRVSGLVQQLDHEISGFRHGQTRDFGAERAVGNADRFRQSRNRNVGAQGEPDAAPVRRIAPPVLALELKRKGFPGPPERRDHGQEPLPFTGNDLDLRLLGERLVGERGNGIDENVEFERVLAERLKAHAGRAVIGHPEPYRDRVPFLQKPMHDLDVQRSVPRPDIALGVIAMLQHGIVRCFNDRVVGTFGVFELGPRLIGRKPEANTERARVVDAIFSRRVDQREALVGPGGEFSRRRQGGGTQVLGIDGVPDYRRRKSC